MKRLVSAVALLGLALGTVARADDSKRLRVISWADYVPADLIADFQQGDRHPGRGHAVEQRGDDLQAARHRRRRLRPRAALAGPDRRRAARIRHLQADRPRARSSSSSSCRSSLEIVTKNATVDGKLYGAAVRVGHRRPGGQRQEGQDRRLSRTCAAPTSRARRRCACKRPTLMAFALASGKDPFALYGRHQGLRGADGAGRPHADRLQGELPLLLRQQGPAAERRALRRDRRRDDVGLPAAGS